MFYYKVIGQTNILKVVIKLVPLQYLEHNQILKRNQNSRLKGNQRPKGEESSP
jgi:hypothetical protein